MTRRTLLALAATVLLASCGGDSGGGTSGTSGTTSTTAAPSSTTTVPALPAECAPAPFELMLRQRGSEPAELFGVVDAVAVRKIDGRAYTVYLTDFPIERDQPLFAQVSEPPPGGVTVQTGLDVFNADDAMALPILSPGATGEVEWSAGELATFLTIVAAEIPDFSVDLTGSSELLYVDDTQLCIRADIRSESGFELIGTYTADVVEDF